MFDDGDQSLPYVRESETSKAAAALHAKKAKLIARHIFDQIAAAGDRGMTTDELNVIFEPLGERNQTVSARVKDLADRGMIRRGPDTRKTRTNSDAQVSRAIPEAAEAFDLYWHRRIKKSAAQRATERAAADLVKVAKQLGTQAKNGSLPLFEEAQQCITDAVATLYATLDVDLRCNGGDEDSSTPSQR